MGLSFNKSNVSWSYSGFNQFRDKLAAEIGLNLYNMEGFGGVLPWGNISDPIVPFLNHSDCEGELTSEQCKTIGPRLKHLAQGMDDCRDKDKALELADDMIYLGSSKEPLVFT